MSHPNYFKIPLLWLPPLFRRFQFPVQGKQNSKRTWCQTPAWSFMSNLMDKVFHILMNTFGIYLPQECLLNLLSNLYILPWLGGWGWFSNFWCSNYQKIDILTHAPRQNSPPGYYDHPQSEGNYSFTLTPLPPDNSLLIYSITPETAFFRKSFSPPPAERDLANNYLFKVNNRNTGKRCEICSKLTITLLTLFFCLYCYLWTYFTPFSSTSIVDFEFCLLGREETIWSLS